MKEPINKITLKDGSIRYRLVVDIGRDEHGGRKQLTRTFDTRREAREELSRIRHETNLGTYVKSSKETVNSYLASIGQGSLGVVTDCAGALFWVWCLVAVRAAAAGAARYARVSTGSDCAGTVLLSR